MSNYFSKKTIDFNKLECMFECWKFSCLEASIGSDDSRVLTVFCCQAERLEYMRREWMEVNSHIAAEFLSKSKSTFERWNTYLLFVCTEKTPKSIQYEIENNKFSMRKIVITNQQNFPLDFYDLSQIASQKILSSNIELTKIESNTEEKPNLSEITSRLLESKIGFGQSQSDRDSRELWLSHELGRLRTNED